MVLYRLLEFPTDTVIPTIEIANFVDFIALIDSPSGVRVFVKLNDVKNDPIDLTVTRTVKNPTGKYEIVYMFTQGTYAGGRIKLLVAGEAFVEIPPAITSVSIVSEYVGLAKDSSLKNTPVTVLAPSTVTANGNSDPINTDYGSVITFFLDVTAVSGTNPTLDVYIDIQDPVSGKWVNQDKFAQVTTTGTWALSVYCRSNRYRARWVLGGTTPSFTMSIGAVVIAK